MAKIPDQSYYLKGVRSSEFAALSFSSAWLYSPQKAVRNCSTLLATDEEVVATHLAKML